MMFGPFPPSSRSGRFRLVAASRMICWPTSTEPVKQILSTPGWRASAAPATEPLPGTTFTAPGGKPASFVSRAISSALSGVYSAGLRMTVFPAAAITSSTSASRASATWAKTSSLWGWCTGKVAPEWAGTNSPPTKRPYRVTSVMHATKVKGGKELVPPSHGFVHGFSRSGEPLNSHIPLPRRGARMEGEDSSNSGVKYLVGKTAGKSGVIAGLVATHIATIFGLWFYGARLPKFDFPSLNGYIYVGLPFGFTHPDVAFVVGGVFHYVDGILFGLIFALVVSPMMGRIIKPLAAMTPTANYIKGLIWGWTLWIISSALWMPLLIGPILAPYGAPVGTFLTSFGP